MSSKNEKSAGDTYNVTSTNQSGGATVGKLNINKTDDKGGDLPLWVKWTLGVLAGVVSVIAIYTFFFSGGDMANDDGEGDTYNVESTNQSGGITAGRIDVYNLQPGWRDINQMPQVQQTLLSNLTQFKDRIFRCGSVQGDEEAHNFAYQLRDWLRANGFTVEDFVERSTWVEPMPPFSYKFEGQNDEIVLVTAGNQNSTVPLGG